MIALRHSPITSTPPPPSHTVPLHIVPDPVAPDLMPPAPKSGLKKVSFGKIAPKKEDTKTAYPLFPDADGQAAELATRIIENTETFEALDGALKADKAMLKQLVGPHYFTVNHGRVEVPSSIAVAATPPKQAEGRLLGEPREVLLTFVNKYPTLPDEAPLVPLLGDEVATYFRQVFELKVNGDKLPADHTQELIDGLQELFGRYNALDALEVKQGIKPTAEFHAARHLKLTPDQNLALAGAGLIETMVKTKGRKR